MRKHRLLNFSALTIILASVLFFSFQVADRNRNTNDLIQKSRILWQVITNVADQYVDEVDTNELLDAAIKAITEKLDPHSAYLPPQNFEDFSERFLGYEGIGVTFRMINGKATVMHVLRDGPSERAGLQMGDKIIAAEGKSIVGLEQNEIPPILKGPRGTRVNVTIERPGVDLPIPITISRGRAIQESVRYYYMIDAETGYLKLETFSRTTAKEIQDILRILESRGMKRLVFDLRRNTGGLLSQAVEVADKFMSGGKTIVTTKGRIPSANSVHKSTDSPTDIKYPMIVLVDEISASASEVVSGALQDMDRALIVGKNTFGKGLMQNQFEFEDRSALVLTTGRWYTPLGRLIQKDYENKTHAEYRRDAQNDSLNTVRDLDENRPVFKTPSGRVVYGGGGIKPDIELDATNFVSNFAFSLEGFSNDMPIFLYAQQFSIKHKDRWKNHQDFLQNFHFDDAMQKEFRDYLDSINFDPKTNFGANPAPFTNDDLDKGMSDIGIYFKARVAEFLWGDEARIKVLNKDDNVLHESLKYFDQAGNLIRR